MKGTKPMPKHVDNELFIKLMLMGASIDGTMVRVKVDRGEFKVCFEKDGRTIVTWDNNLRAIEEVVHYVPNHFEELYEEFFREEDGEVVGIILEDILPIEILSTL